MPRAKPITSSPTFESQHVRLAADVRSQLTKLLNLDSAIDGTRSRIRAALREVGVTLGFYLAGQVVIDHVPRAPHYRRAFRNVLKRSLSLQKELRSLDGWCLQRLERNFLDPEGLVYVIDALTDVSAQIVDDSPVRLGRGAPEKAALTECIRRLRHIFQKHYVGKTLPKVSRGKFEHLRPFEKAELDFVYLALVHGGVVDTDVEGKDFQLADLLRLFRDPRCMLATERDAALQQIVRKHRFAREKRRRHSESK